MQGPRHEVVQGAATGARAEWAEETRGIINIARCMEQLDQESVQHWADVLNRVPDRGRMAGSPQRLPTATCGPQDNLVKHPCREVAPTPPPPTTRHERGRRRKWRNHQQ